MTSKENIIFQSLLLFSIDGYDAVSTRAIARAVNASDAVIYKHFKNKNAILDAIVQLCVERLCNKRNEINLETIDWTDVEGLCLNMFRFQTSDEWITPFRRMLIIEQYKNPEMKKIYKEFFVDLPTNSTADIFEKLISFGYVRPADPKVYAMQLYAPFFMCHTLDDENGELLNQLKAHVKSFCEYIRV